MTNMIFEGLAYGMLLFLISVGLSITMGLMNFVNLAHGGFAMVGGYAASLAMQHAHIGFYPSLAIGFFAAVLAGAILEVLFFRWLYRAHALDQVLLTIGLVFVMVATATYFFGATVQPFNLPPSLTGNLSWGPYEIGRYRLFLIVSGLIITGALLLGLVNTRYGAMVRAAVDNQRIAKCTGINVDRLFFITFSLGCGLAGLGGTLSLGMLSLDSYFPLKYMVYFLIVVCVGGAGTIIGPFVTALIVGLIDVASRYYLPQVGTFPVYLFMIIALVLRPHGIVRRKGIA